jgi:Tripartite tricarboxylate transporter TctB family
MALLNKNIIAGAMFVALGGVAVGLSLGYKVGTAGHMGPGYVPLIFGSGMAIFGALIAARGVVDALTDPSRSNVDLKSWNPRPLLAVLIGILVFAALIKPAGLIVASLALLVCGSQGVKGQRILETVYLSIALIAIVGIVFVYLIGVRIELLPSSAVFSWI